MRHEDFSTKFDCVEICSLTPASLVKLNEKCSKKMKKKSFDADCVQKCNGKLNFCMEKLYKDPKHIIKIKKNCKAIICVSHKNLRELMMKNPRGECLFPIGLLMRTIAEDSKNVCLPNEIFKNCLVGNELELFDEKVRLPRFTKTFEIPSGEYVVIPYTKYQKGEFFIRIFYESESSSRIKKVQICMKFVEELMMRRFT